MPDVLKLGLDKILKNVSIYEGGDGMKRLFACIALILAASYAGIELEKHNSLPRTFSSLGLLIGMGIALSLVICYFLPKDKE